MELPQPSRAENRAVSSKTDFLYDLDPIRALIRDNPDAWAELQTFIRVAQGWTLGFVEVNFPDEAQGLVTALQALPAAEHWQIVHIVLDDPNLRYVRDAVLERLATVEPTPPDRKRVVIITGLEWAIGMTGDDPPLLQDLNLVRDAYVSSVPHPMLVVLPDYSLTRLARFAPDFWAWRSATFRFKTTTHRRDLAHWEYETGESQPYLAHWEYETGESQRFVDVPKLKARIDLLERLLMECCPTGEQPSSANRALQIKLLRKLGDLYRDCGSLEKSSNLLQQGLDLVGDSDPRKRIDLLRSWGYLQDKKREFNQALATYQEAIDLTDRLDDPVTHAGLIHVCGNACLEMRKFEEARRYYQQALDLKIEFGDRHSQASTYHQLGSVAQALREFDQARHYYQKALEFGNRYAQAKTYHNLGVVAQALQEFDQARRYYQQALDLKIEFGDRYAQAKTYHNLGVVAQELREFDQARHHYQQALDLKTEFGDRYAQASTYHNLGSIAQALREFPQARHDYQQALDLKIEFGDRYEQACTYHNLGIVAQQLREFDQACRHYQQALDIYIEFGDFYEQAGTYHQIGLLAAAQENYPEATKNLLLALQIFGQFNDSYNAQITLGNLARIYQQTQDESIFAKIAKVLGISPNDLQNYNISPERLIKKQSGVLFRMRKIFLSVLSVCTKFRQALKGLLRNL
ncbi:MAG: tetratricopeptide repeat protein [Spirulinaceae cyanobacterium]